jgi:hypothetical protein
VSQIGRSSEIGLAEFRGGTRMAGGLLADELMKMAAKIQWPRDLDCRCY